MCPILKERNNKRLNCKQLDTNRLIHYSATTSIYRTINETVDSGHEVSSNIPLVACLLAHTQVMWEERDGLVLTACTCVAISP